MVGRRHDTGTYVRRSATALAAAVLLAAAGAPAAQATPALPDGLVDDLLRTTARLLPPQDLGVPGNDTPMLVTDGGVVVTTSGGITRSDSYLWDAQRGPVLVPAELYPHDVNDHGVVLGYGLGQTSALVWSPGGEVESLVPADRPVSLGAINNEGAVSLTFQEPGWTYRGAVVRDGEVVELGLSRESYLGGRGSMNDRGEVAGLMHSSWMDPQAFVWRDGEVRLLVNTGGGRPDVRRINARGDVLGRTWWPVVWWADGTMQPLDTGASGTAEPIDINDAGVVVGNATPHDAPARPVVWDHRGLTVLPVAGFAGGGAKDIGNQGVVAGWLERGGAQRPAVWVHGVPVLLGMDLPGRRGLGGTASHVTDDGRVIGVVRHAAGNDTVVWDLLPRR